MEINVAYEFTKNKDRNNSVPFPVDSGANPSASYTPWFSFKLEEKKNSICKLIVVENSGGDT